MRTFLTFASLIVFTVFSLAQNDKPDLLQAEQNHGQQILHFRANPLTQDYDLKYYRFEWVINPAVNYIQGRVTAYFEPTENGFQDLHFDFANNLTINEVKYHGASLSTFTGLADDVLQVSLPTVVPTGQLDSVTIAYEGVPGGGGFGAFTQTQHNGTPIIWTLSEPYGARNWWPTKQDLNDKIDSIDVYVLTPALYRVASNGVLVSEQTAGPDKLYHWQSHYPIAAYLVAIGVTDYAVYSDYVPVPGGNDIEVLNYVYPENLATAQSRTPDIIPIMHLFNDRFGLYPFANEKYGHAQFGFGGGMEHQTMTFLNGFSHLLLSHELAHQWFGDKVTCGSWQDIWLNEGFATYSEGLTYNYGLGNQNWHEWLQGKITQVTSQPGGSVFVDDTTNVGRIFSSRLSYSKGALVLHMLRWKLGDDAFFQGVRDYLDDPALAYGYARTADLKAHLEAAGGQDLTEFFNDWFYGQGFPSYQVSWEQTGSEVKLALGQTTSDASVGFFEMPVPIEFKGGMGEDTVMVFDHSYSGQQFSFNLPFEVAQVVFDPELWLLSANNQINLGVATRALDELERSITLSPNPAGSELHLEMAGGAQPAFQRFDLLDLEGRLLQSYLPEDIGGGISVGQLNAGTYLLRIVVKDGFVVKKFIKV